MTGNITKLSSSYLLNQVSVSNGSVSNVQNNNSSFSNFLKTGNQQNGNNVKVADAKEGLKETKNDFSADSRMKKSDRIKNVADTMDKKDIEDVNVAVEEAAQNVYDEVKNATGADEEVMAEAMEALGLTVTDLLDTSNVTELFVEISGLEDASELLTNEGLSTDLTNLLNDTNQITKDLLDELGMSMEEINQAIEQFELGKNELTGEVQNMVADGSDLEKKPLYDNEREEGPAVIINDTRTPEQKEKVDENESAIVEKTDVSKVQTRAQKSDNKEQGFGENAFAQNQMNDNEVSFVDSVGEIDNTASYVSATTQEIVKQIVEQIKINITATTSTMEMELNPASLGHVGLTIESKAGAITATFTAQNEVVKEAIESQISELRENIESQGMKIDAVEVAVASHQFEQNLQQNDRNASSEEENSRRTQRAGRRLRLNLSEEMEEDELSEEERIAKEIMEENGNSIDFTA